MKHYIFLHVLSMNELKFPPSIVAVINNNPAAFNRDEHGFITPHKAVYELLKHHDNVHLADDVADTGRMSQYEKVINQYGDCCDWIIVHDICYPNLVLKIKPKYWKKIIWRTWGGAILYDYQFSWNPKELAKNAVKFLINGMAKIAYHSFYAFGVANAVDAIDLTRRVGKGLKMYRMSYGTTAGAEIREQVLAAGKANTTGSLNVLIGHSGFLLDNHIEVIDRVKKYKDENVTFYFLMAYGDSAYIQSVKEKAAAELGNKAVFVEQMMPLHDYIAFINKMDVVILDAQCSTALGMLMNTLYFRKKCFINRNGLYKVVFDQDGLPYNCTDEIDGMTFEAFSKEPCYPENYEESSLHPQTRERNEANWLALMNELKEETRR